MSSKKSLIIIKYLKLVEDIEKYTFINIFPDCNDVVDIIFYFNYTFIKEFYFYQIVDDILEINKIELGDEEFGIVSDLILEFIIFLKNL